MLADVPSAAHLHWAIPLVGGGYRITASPIDPGHRLVLELGGSGQALLLGVAVAVVLGIRDGYVGAVSERAPADHDRAVPGPTEDLASREELGGIVPPDLSKFDLANHQTRYEIYYDSPGHIDLVARKENEVWLIEAKGLTKGAGAPGVIAEAIGQTVIIMDPEHIGYRYGILLPKEKRFLDVLSGISDENTLLSREDFYVFWATGDGDIELDPRFSSA